MTEPMFRKTCVTKTYKQKQNSMSVIQTLYTVMCRRRCRHSCERFVLLLYVRNDFIAQCESHIKLSEMLVSI